MALILYNLLRFVLWARICSTVGRDGLLVGSGEHPASPARPPRIPPHQGRERATCFCRCGRSPGSCVVSTDTKVRINVLETYSFFSSTTLESLTTAWLGWKYSLFTQPLLGGSTVYFVVWEVEWLLSKFSIFLGCCFSDPLARERLWLRHFLVIPVGASRLLILQHPVWVIWD